MVDYDSNKTKNRVIILMLVVLGIMITAVITLAHRLDVVTPGGDDTSTWNINFTNIEEYQRTGFAKAFREAKFVGTYAEFYVLFDQIGDSYTYQITVSNDGNMDAKVDSVILHENNINDDLKYEVSGINENDVLKSGEKKTFYVKASYISDDEVPQEQQDKASIYINFVQEV